MNKINKIMNKTLSILVLYLFMLLPLASALSINSVNVQEVSDRYSIINWKTDEAASGSVQYGTNSSPLSRITSNQLTVNHTIMLSPLRNSTDYSFNISSINENGTSADGPFNFTTALSDTINPFIGVNLPDYYGSTTLNVQGTTEPNSEVYVYVNGIISGAGFQVTKNDGVISLPGVLLKSGSGKVTPNQVRILVKDPSGNQNEITKTVNVDKTPPAITFDKPIPSAIRELSLPITGNSDEPAALDVTATDKNGKIVFSNTVNVASPWQVTMTFPSDGQYVINFYATDRAGNVFSQRNVILVDTKPLHISETNLARINPSYTVQTVVRGKVNKPGANIIIFVNNQTTSDVTHLDLGQGTLVNVPTSISELVSRISSGTLSGNKLSYVTKADDQGNFAVPIELTTQFAMSDQDIQNVASSTQAAGSQIQLSTGNSWRNSVEVFAIDAAGWTDTTKTLPVYYTRCSTGGIFSISSPVPSPGSLSEPMLKQGAAMFILMMDLSWAGSVQPSDVTVNSMTVKKQPISREDSEGRYNLTVGTNAIFDGATLYPSPRSITPQTKQISAIVRLRPPTTDIFPNNISLDNSFVSLEFPLMLEISYSYLEANGNTASRVQRTCIDANLQVEPDASHFSKYLPRSLLRGVVNAINSTLSLIDTTQKGVTKAYTASLIGCGVGIVAQTARLFWTRGVDCLGVDIRTKLQDGTCHLNYDTDGKPVYDCDGAQSEDEKTKLRACLESNLYSLTTQKYLIDLSCSRVFCPTIPSLNRQSLTYSDLIVRPSVPLRQGTSSSGAVKDTSLNDAASACARFPFDSAGCKAEFERGWGFAAIFNLPYSSAYDRAFKQTQKVGTEITGIGDFLQRAESAVDNMCVKTDSEIRYIRTPENPGKQDGIKTVFRIAPLRTPTTVAVPIDPNLPGAGTVDVVDKVDVSYTFGLGKYLESEVIRAQQSGVNVLNPKPAEESKYYIELIPELKPGVDYDPNKWTCITPICKEAVVCGTYGKGCNTPNEVKIPPNVVSLMAGLPTKEYSFDPTSSLVNSARAMCFPALTGQLNNYKSMLTVAQICFKTILETGKGSAGVCNAFISNVICDAVADVIRCIGVSASNIAASTGLGKSPTFNTFAPFKGIVGAGEAISETLSSKYGGTTAYTTLFDQNKLIKSVCIAAFTGDWDLGISDLLNQAAVAPVKPVCEAAVAQRKFILANPLAQGRPTYSYHVAGLVTGGAEVSNVQFQLVCSATNSCPDNPGGICDCSKVGERAINIPDVQTSVRLGDVLNVEKYYPVQDSEYRYDKFRISYTYKNNQGEQVTVTDCQKSLSSEGFPPSNCRFDIDKGFRCEFTIGDSGTARFVEKPKAQIDDATGQSKVYTPNVPGLNQLRFPMVVESVSPNSANVIPKFVKFTIKNQLGNVVTTPKYYPLDEGIQSYSEFPGIEIKPEMFYSQGTVNAPSIALLGSTGSKDRPANVVQGTQKADSGIGNALHFVVLFLDKNNKNNFNCVDYTDQLGKINLINKVQAVGGTVDSNSQISCNGVSFKIVNSDSIQPSSKTLNNIANLDGFDGTYYKVDYVPPTVSGDCTSGIENWPVEAQLFHSTKNANGEYVPSSIPVVSDNGEEKVQFSIRATCQNPQIAATTGTSSSTPFKIDAFGLTPNEIKIGSSVTAAFTVRANKDIKLLQIQFGDDAAKRVNIDLNRPGYTGSVIREGQQVFNMPDVAPGSNIKVSIVYRTQDDTADNVILTDYVISKVTR